MEETGLGGKGRVLYYAAAAGGTFPLASRASSHFYRVWNQGTAKVAIFKDSDRGHGMGLEPGSSLDVDAESITLDPTSAGIVLIEYEILS